MPQNPNLKQTIAFPGGNNAALVIATPDLRPEAILSLLGITAPAQVVLLFGGADHLAEPFAARIRQTLANSIIPMAASAKGLILDGGTHSGVMALAGEIVAEQNVNLPLIGVAPRGKARYPGGPSLDRVADAADLDHNHSLFVLSPTDEWGSEIDTLFALATELARTSPVIAVVAGGGPQTKAEVARAVRAGWTVVVIQESGGYSEELVSLEDAATREIAASGDLRALPLDAAAATFSEILESQRNDRALLDHAWSCFREYDGNARRLQKVFGRLQGGILVTGILAVVLISIQKELADEFPKSLKTPLPYLKGTWEGALHLAILCLPILGAFLAGISHQFKPGDKWVLLRGGAEAVKREIFRYRARTGGDTLADSSGNSARGLLAERLKTIAERLIRTDVSKEGCQTFAAKPSVHDSFDRLTPSQYVELRVDDQLKFYAKRIQKLSRRNFWFSVSSLFVGGFGTVLAALKLEVWIAVTTTVSTALLTYLRYYQTEETLTKYNYTKGDLTEVKVWWSQLSIAEKRMRPNIDKLVDLTERVLEQETAGWSQRMIEALAELNHDGKKPLHEEPAAGAAGSPAA